MFACPPLTGTVKVKIDLEPVASNNRKEKQQTIANNPHKKKRDREPKGSGGDVLQDTNLHSREADKGRIWPFIVLILGYWKHCREADNVLYLKISDYAIEGMHSYMANNLVDLYNSRYAFNWQMLNNYK